MVRSPATSKKEKETVAKIRGHAVLLSTQHIEVAHRRAGSESTQFITANPGLMFLWERLVTGRICIKPAQYMHTDTFIYNGVVH